MKTHVHSKMTKEMLKLIPEQIVSFFKSKINGHKAIDMIITGSYIEDTTLGTNAKAGDAVAPWLEHFWQQNLGEYGLDYPNSSIASELLMDIDLSDNRAAYRRASDYWDDYVIGNKPKWNLKSAVEKEEALIYLGRIIHLLQDMATPAHVNNDMHLGILGFIDDDDYEDYTGSKCDDAIPSKYQVSSNLKLFNESDWSIKDFFHNLASETRKYDSDDIDGTGSGLPYRCPAWSKEEDEDGHNFFRDPTGDLTDWACDAIAQNMMPLSYVYASSLLLKFLNNLEVYSHAITSLGKSCKLDINLYNITIDTDQDYFGSGEVVLKVISGAINKHVDDSNIEQLGDMSSGQRISCDYHIGTREIKQDESIEVYIEVFDDDITEVRDFIGKAIFKISYNDVKDYINSNENYKVSTGDGVEIELKIKATATVDSTTPIEGKEALEFYTLDIKSLDREQSGFFGAFLGRDDIEIQNFGDSSTKTILSTSETMRLIEKDLVGSDDEVNDFPWDRWKHWIGLHNHVENVNIDGSSGQHRIRVNINGYSTPPKPTSVEASTFKVNGYLHSTEKPLGHNKYNTTIKKELAFKDVFISSESDLTITLNINGLNFNLSVSNDEWNCWIHDGFGLYTAVIHNVKYNFILELEKLEPSYKITSYLNKIYVNYDEDPDPLYGYAGEDWGEVHAKYKVNGSMIDNFYLGTIGTGHSKMINKQLGEENVVYTKNNSIRFDIVVTEADGGLNENDSMGTVKVDIPYSEWSRWPIQNDGHITGYINSSNKDCSLKFKFKIKKEALVVPQTTHKSSNIHAVTAPNLILNQNLFIAMPAFDLNAFTKHIPKIMKRIPSYHEVKEDLIKPLVDQKELKSKSAYYYNVSKRGTLNLRNTKIVLHRKGCSLLDAKNAKILYLKRGDIDKIKSIKRTSLLHPYFALKSLEDELKFIPTKLAREYINTLRNKNLLDSKSNYKSVKESFLSILETRNTRDMANLKLKDSAEFKAITKASKPSKYHLRILTKQLSYSNMHITLLKNKVDKLSKIKKSLSRTEQTNMYLFKKALKNATFCPKCNLYARLG